MTLRADKIIRQHKRPAREQAFGRELASVIEVGDVDAADPCDLDIRGATDVVALDGYRAFVAIAADEQRKLIALLSHHAIREFRLVEGCDAVNGIAGGELDRSGGHLAKLGGAALTGRRAGIEIDSDLAGEGFRVRLRGCDAPEWRFDDAVLAVLADADTIPDTVLHAMGHEDCSAHEEDEDHYEHKADDQENFANATTAR